MILDVCGVGDSRLQGEGPVRYCTTVLLAALSGALFLSEDVVAFDSFAFSEIDAAIAERTDISDAKKRGLSEAAERVLAQHEDLGADKHAKIREHTTLYLDRLIKNSSSQTDKQFRVKIMTFEWQLGNYCRLSPIDDGDRARGKALLENVPEGVRKVVYETFTDTPDDIKERLIDEVLKEFSEDTEVLGNYYYLTSYLYPSENALSADEVALAIRKHPFQQNNATAFASVAEILSNPDFHKLSKESHLEAFLWRESGKFHMPLQAATTKAFRRHYIEPGQYQPPPPELTEAQQKLHEELVEQSRKMMEEARKRMLLGDKLDYKDVANEALEELPDTFDGYLSDEPTQDPMPREDADEKSVAEAPSPVTLEPVAGKFPTVALLAAGVLAVVVVLVAAISIRRGRKG